ncbi:pilus assembly protein TadG-related protein [Microbispora sp. H10830]|uniref:pilus assembly protein TadG-related protein n=1 Tax=Microbispora sp. H10830 TaxID=2729109 RepID=UPI00160483DE|nr:pilus assembly protein TadG-related protein [Microbispora sp. H10830]
MLDGDRGSISGFVVVVMLAALVCLGLVVDGGQKIRAFREAYAVAEEAARAGAGVVDVDRAYAQGGRFELDTANALAAARAYLASSGHRGSVAMAGGRTLRVTVNVSRPTVLLSLIGVADVTATASASARMLQGIEQGE